MRGGLRGTGCEFRVTGGGLRGAGCGVRGAGCSLGDDWKCKAKGFGVEISHSTKGKKTWKE
jgi:hypothetical protein